MSVNESGATAVPSAQLPKGFAVTMQQMQSHSRSHLISAAILGTAIQKPVLHRENPRKLRFAAGP